MLRRLIRKVKGTLLGRKTRVTPVQPVEFIGAQSVPEQSPAQRRKHEAHGSHTHVQTGKPERHGHKSSGRRHDRPEREKRPDRPSHGGRGRDSRGERSDRPRHQPQPAKPPRTRELPADNWTIAEFKVEQVEGRSRFHDFNLPARIMHGIADMGFQYCTPVQAQVLPPALSGRNVAAQSQTGTGKTAAFLLASFNRFLSEQTPQEQKPGCPRALVLAPTRELAVQIGEDARALGRYCGIHTIVVFGGMDYREQKSDLQGGYVDLIVATPGRLLDFEKQREINLGNVEILVIDEADRMLDMGFIPDVSRIISRLPPKEKRQTMLFSATLSPDVLRLASRWMSDPAHVEIEPDKVTVDKVDQRIYALNSRDKFTVLYNLIKRENPVRTIVFGNRRDTTRGLCDDLRRCDIGCDLLSGDMPQEKRMKTLDAFKSGKLPVVVATDVAARGIHVDDISHVINFDVPYEAEDYVHRIGRTARVGKTGKAFTFACEREAFTIPEIEKYIGRSIPCMQPEEELLVPPPVAPLGARVRERRGGGPGGPGGFRRGPRSHSGGPRRGGPSRGRSMSMSRS